MCPKDAFAMNHHLSWPATTNDRPPHVGMAIDYCVVFQTVMLAPTNILPTSSMSNLFSVANPVCRRRLSDSDRCSISAMPFASCISPGNNKSTPRWRRRPQPITMNHPTAEINSCICISNIHDTGRAPPFPLLVTIDSGLWDSFPLRKSSFSMTLRLYRCMQVGKHTYVKARKRPR